MGPLVVLGSLALCVSAVLVLTCRRYVLFVLLVLLVCVQLTRQVYDGRAGQLALVERTGWFSVSDLLWFTEGFLDRYTFTLLWVTLMIRDGRWQWGVDVLMGWAIVALLHLPLESREKDVIFACVLAAVFLVSWGAGMLRWRFGRWGTGTSGETAMLTSAVMLGILAMVMFFANGWREHGSIWDFVIAIWGALVALVLHHEARVQDQRQSAQAFAQSTL